MEDLRGSWPCAWCDEERVTKRGTICAPCNVKLDAGRFFRQLDDPPPAPTLLEEPASYTRPWQEVTPKDDYL